MIAHTTAQHRDPRHAFRPPGGPTRRRGRGPWRQAAALRASIAWRGRLQQVVWAVVLLALGLAGVSAPVQAQPVRPFSSRFTTNNRGDIFIIGNTLLSCAPKLPNVPLAPPTEIPPGSLSDIGEEVFDDFEQCDPNIARLGKGFVLDDGELEEARGSELSNQSYRMRPINLAVEPGPGITNSSSARLDLPNGASVLWAGLYWSARTTQSDPPRMVCDPTQKTSPSRVCFATPTSAGYLSKTGTLGPDLSTDGNGVYQNFVEVTAEVQQGGSGTYSVADVDARDGRDGIGTFAGWSLVLVIGNPSEPLRNLTVFDGFAHVDGNNQSNTAATTVPVHVEGFLTPQTGAVTTHLGVVSYEGDLGATGDTIKLNGVTLSEPNNVRPADNFFNSGISRLGQPVTTKTPPFINQLGFDIAVVDASGILAPGATSADFVFFSASEVYYPGIFTFASDLFLPLVNVVKVAVDLDQGAVLPGDVLQYIMLLLNSGTDTAVNQVLRDAIPAGTTYVPGSLQILAGANAGATPTDAIGDDLAEFTGSEVVFRLGTGATATTGGSLARGEFTLIRFRVQIDANAAFESEIVNQAVTTYNSQTLPDQTLTANSDSDVRTPGEQPSTVTVGKEIALLFLRKNVAPTPTVVAGERLTYTLTAINVGPNDAAEVTLRDATPPGTTFVSATAPASWTVSAPAPGGTGLITFTRPSLPPDLEGVLELLRDVSTLRDLPTLPAQFTIVVQVDAGVPVGTLISNTATLTSPTDPLSPHMADTTVEVIGSGPPDLSITKTDEQTLVVPGAVLIYTVVVRNNGPGAVTGATVTDPVPATLTDVTWTCTASPGSSCPASGAGAIDVSVDLLVGGTATFTLSATVDPAAVGTVENQTTVTAPDGTVKTTTDIDQVLLPQIEGPPVADLSITKTDNATEALPGAQVTYTVVVRNNGPVSVTGVPVTDTVPATLTDVTWTCTASPGSSCPASGTGSINVQVDLLVGGTATFTLSATVAATATGRIVNQARVTAPDGTISIATDRDRVISLIEGPPAADLSITKTDNATEVLPGARVTYTVLVRNNGPGAVTGVPVTDTVPATLTDVTWTCTASPGSSCPASGTGSIAVQVDLLEGGTATFTLSATVAATAAGTIVNQATVTAPDGTITIATDRNRVISLIGSGLSAADLSITKTDNVVETVPGARVTYTLVVRNNGPSAVTGATVNDPVPTTLTDVTWICTASPGSSCPAAGTGSINVQVDLLVDGTATFTLSATVAPTATGTIMNAATVRPPTGALDLVSNNKTIDSTTTRPAPGLPSSGFNPPSGRKTVETTELPDLAWRVVWINSANAEPLRIRVIDPIPATTTYVDGSVLCTPRGRSTVLRCDFEAATNRLFYEGVVGPDPGATTEDQAVNEVVITFQTSVLPGATQVANQALASWDANGNGSVDDDLAAGQGPVRTGTTFGQNDPTVVTLPGLMCLFQQRLLALTLPPSAPTASGSGDGGGDGGSGGDGAVDSGVDRQIASDSEEVFVLLTPLDSDTVAGSTLTLAAGQVPVAGTTVSQPTEIRIANGAPAATLDIVENVGSKTERIPAREAHVVLTVDGVVADRPAILLGTEEILRLERVDPSAAPAPLPGVAVSPLVAATLASGRTALDSPFRLSLPYADADHDGFVDDTSPALQELALTMWFFDAARQRWVPLPEARVFTAFNVLRVTTAQMGLYGVFQAADGSTGLAGVSGPAFPAPQSAEAQGSGWQDIGVVTTFPFLVPLNTTTLPNGTYAVRVSCVTQLADLAAVQAAPTPTVAGGSVSDGGGGGGGGGGGCSLRPGSVGARGTVLDALGNIGLPLVVLLVLGLRVWRRLR